MILNCDEFWSMGAYSGIVLVNRLLSDVTKSRSSVVGDENSTLDLALSIFLR